MRQFTLYHLFCFVPSLIFQFSALLATHALICLFPDYSGVYSLISFLLYFYWRICKSAPRKFTSSTNDSYLNKYAFGVSVLNISTLMIPGQFCD